MKTFKDAVENTLVEVRTENGMKTYDSSLDACVDLFFAIGASRGKDITPKFEAAFAQDAVLAAKILLWSRDVRGGAGERQIFRDMLLNISKNHSDYIEPIINLTPEIGRFDDLLVLENTKHQTMAFDKIGAALKEGDGLAAKWLARKGKTAAELSNHFGWSPKFYRKTLVGLTKVVETQMCSKDWDNINFNHVPSLASVRYQTAFHRNAPVAYQEYKDALEKGEAKVNAGAVYPYDVLAPLTRGYYGSYPETENLEVIRAQWNSLPNYIGDASILPMVDVSGSMRCNVGENENLTCMTVAVSLGLYLADKNTGPFSDMFLTFSDESKINVLKGDIIAKTKQLLKADWGMATNLHSAFNEVLRVATQNKVETSEMPQYILILSDMEFNYCVNHNDTSMQMIERKYEEA